MGSDTASASLLVGCLLALLTRRGLPDGRLPAWLLVSGSATVLALATFGSSAWAFAVAVPTVATGWAAVLIWARAPLTWRPLNYVGSRSYAVYLWHVGILWLTLTVVGHSLWWMAIGIALTFGVAEVSWRLVEVPARRRWHQSADARPRPTSPPAAPFGPGHGALDVREPPTRLGVVSPN
jgi:peptidoglycan/LPS O-acetylase OafA/YrhL